MDKKYLAKIIATDNEGLQMISACCSGAKVKISDIKFEGQGCAITMASASMMTELMKNKEEQEVKELIDDFLKMIKDSPELNSKIISEDEKTKLMSLSGVKKYPMRVKCATLPWHTLVSAMTDKPGEVNTEKED